MDTDKLIMIAIVLLTLGVFGFIAVTSFKTVKPTVTPTKEVLLQNNPNYKGLNPNDSPLTIVEFSDFQCPACKNFEPYIDAIYNDYKDRMSFVFKHFPLKNIHPLATDAAKAAEAAALQGKFWEYHSTLFIESPNLKAENLIKYAENLGLDVDKFKADLNSDVITKKVEDDFALADQLGLQGTPTIFIIEGDKVEKYNPQGEDLRVIIERRLGVEPKAEVAPEGVESAEGDAGDSQTDSSQSQQTGPEQSAVMAAQLNLLNVQDKGVTPSEIKVVNVEKGEWSDGSLGCPEEGKTYTQAVVPGYKITLEAKGEQFEYHTNEDGAQIALCGK